MRQARTYLRAAILGGWLGLAALLYGCGAPQVVKETVVVVVTPTPPPGTTAPPPADTAVATGAETIVATPADTVAATPADTTVPTAASTAPPTLTASTASSPTTRPALTSTPTNPPPPPPTLTPPVVILPPFDGGMNVAQIAPNNQDPLVTNELVFEVQANDVKAGEKNGSGVASVDMRVVDAHGQTVYAHTEQQAKYCFFGGSANKCNVWKFSDHGGKWPNGKTAGRGAYFLWALAHGKNGKTRTVEAVMYYDPGSNGNDSPVAVNVVQTQDSFDNFDVSKQLVFQAESFDTRVGNTDGNGIDHVDFQVVDELGNIVHQHTENTAKYCAFGGGEPNCNVWDFAGHNNRWDTGKPIYDNTQYFLRAVAYAKDGTMGATDEEVRIHLGP